jgi:hypothetical protein
MDPGKRVEEKNDYLWNGSGQPDPEIQKLEGLLGKYRHDGAAHVFPAIVAQERWTARLRKMRLFPAMAAAAAVLIIAAGILVFLRVHGHGPTQVAAGWNVSPLAGAPRVGRRAITADQGSARLGVGQLLETDYQSRASLQSEEIGQVEVEPSSRVRLLAMGGLKRIALDHGTIHAFIWAPPGQFVVDTPSATTVDLGCAYTLQVDDSGAGLLRTSLGWVGFTLNGHESFIPAGAACATRPKVGPGTPYFEDASAEFRAALARFDFEDNTAQQHATDLATILAESRVHDALTLWHLLSRVDADHRVRVYERLRELAPPPPGVTKDGILRLDQAMLDQWWNSLGFDDISIWRRWAHAWSGASARGKE